MKNIIILVFIAFSFCACSSGHFIRAQHNGKIYWLPPECENKYSPIEGSDEISCIGVKEPIKPTSEEEYRTYLYEREVNSYYEPNMLIMIDPWPRHYYYYHGHRWHRPPPPHHWHRPPPPHHWHRPPPPPHFRHR